MQRVAGRPGPPAGGWAGTVLLATATALLTGLVAAGLPPVGLDAQVDAAVRALGRAHRWVPSAAEPVTVLANPRVDLLGTLVLVGATLLLRWATPGDGPAGTGARRALLPLLGLAVTVPALKIAVGRTGPRHEHVGHLGLGWFPSGHTTTATVCAGVLAALWAPRSGRARVAAVAWPAAVAAAMVLHRYHWLSDVVAGGLLGALLLRTGGPAARGDARRVSRRSSATP